MSSSKHRRNIILCNDPHIKSLAALILLNKKYQKNEISEWLSFRDDYLERHLPLVCSYCGKENLLKDSDTRKQPHNLATIDHIKPLARGGPRYDESNLTVACYSCNQRKGDSFDD